MSWTRSVAARRRETAQDWPGWDLIFLFDISNHEPFPPPRESQLPLSLLGRGKGDRAEPLLLLTVLLSNNLGNDFSGFFSFSAPPVITKRLLTPRVGERSANIRLSGVRWERPFHCWCRCVAPWLCLSPEQRDTYLWVPFPWAEGHLPLNTGQIFHTVAAPSRLYCPRANSI